MSRVTLTGSKSHDRYHGTVGDDTISIVGASAASENALLGLSGNDHIYGGMSRDYLMGDAGNDILYGKDGRDYFQGGDGNDVLYGGKGNDSLWEILSTGNDVMYGGSGNDMLSDMAAGPEVYENRSGNDHLYGGSGNDHIVAGGGNDVYEGGSGFDTLSFDGARRGVTIDAGKGISDGLGHDVFSGFEQYFGSRSDDNFKGSSRADVFFGAGGNDIIRGMGGADKLSSGQGNGRFVWEKSDLDAVDHILNFQKGDVLDIHNLVKVSAGSIGDVVHVTDSAVGSTVSVKIDGHFVNVAILNGVHGLAVSDMHHDGAILV